ncbi:unnamed protein product [Ceutorhynchus assimilis]|uniref:Cytochrome P450 n=1 Tax=Ceutorhynchus assimilis TaxID=467358 RepID=A0A9N9MP60_9CUCU|nr:unnamed protein product [Ceutorhynchus assimilis]
MFYTLIFIVLVTIIFYIKRKYSYWIRKKVPGPTPWPIFGNLFHNFTKRKTVGQIFRQIYSTYPEEPLVGVYRTSEPVLLIRDPEFINRILTKDAKSFFNNDFSVDKKTDPLQGESPFVQKDNEWKETRKMLSPGFTSGKMRPLFTIIEQVNVRLKHYLEKHEGQTLETQNLCRRYTLDNVALVAFGINGNCFDSDESDFMKLANSFIAPGTFALWMLQMFPLISYLVSLKAIPKEVDDGLTTIIKDVLESRKKNNIVVNDYLNFIAELGNKNSLRCVEMAGHAATFFEDGYETSALVMSYILFNLAQSQHVQDKLRSEIGEFEKQNPNRKVTYEDIVEMKYLNACIYESMRLCPILEYYTRVCNQPYVYTTSTESPLHLKRMAANIDAGTVCIIPFGGLCHDERYFSEPQVFKPERFLDKDCNGFRGVFYPFGGGHRICLGQRFGIMQVRMGIIEIIKNFQVNLSDKTKLPFEFLPWTILNKVKHGVWLTYKKL